LYSVVINSDYYSTIIPDYVDTTPCMYCNMTHSRHA